MTIYVKKYPFCAEEGSGLTLLEAERAFQLSPDPPKVENINDYIVMAAHGDENGFTFFLHSTAAFAVFFCERVFGIPSRIACSIISWPACVLCWRFCQAMIPTAVRAF